MNNSQDQEIEIIVNNVVCTFTLGCSLNLRRIAMQAANVIYKREQSVGCGRASVRETDRSRVCVSAD